MSDRSTPPAEGDTRGDVLLRETLGMLQPLVRLLIGHGVAYPQFAQALKSVFLDAARAELAAGDRRPTDSALSLLSGVHRKDVRAMTRPEEVEARPRKALSMAAEVYGRWTNDPAWCDGPGVPVDLPIRARDPGERSFEGLAASVSKDFHPRTVLEELVRLGVARIDGDRVHVEAASFVPQGGFAEMVYYLARNVGDHLAAAAANVGRRDTGDPSFLENSLAADGLEPASVAELETMARAHWQAVFRQMFAAAAERFERDRGAPAGPRLRLRFGAYFYSEPDPGGATAPPDEPGNDPPAAPASGPSGTATQPPVPA